MKGTSNEVLMWLTEHSGYAQLMQMSRQRLVGLRKHLRCNEVSERRKDEILERLEKRMSALKSTKSGSTYEGLGMVRKVRNQYILPAVVRDHHGKFFSELTLLKMVEDEEKMRDLNLERVCRTFKRGDFPSKEIVREVLNRKGWSMFEERTVLPSVWEVDEAESY